MLGSSPRVWGQVLLCKLILNRFRIIPTRMGTSCTCVLVCCCVWDHPHAYGDKPRGDMQRILRIGSSPRVWGQGICDTIICDNAGIIPTRMGTSSISRGSIFTFWDHPHAYGDKHVITVWTMITQGSSPRVWGQDRLISVILLINRIIPTRMGTRLRYTY